MDIMRPVLLWCSENRWMRRNVPNLWFVRRAVKRFMPGETAEEALAEARALNNRSLGAIVTQLGENISGQTEAEAVVDHYLGVLKGIGESGLDPRGADVHLVGHAAFSDRGRPRAREGRRRELCSPLLLAVMSPIRSCFVLGANASWPGCAPFSRRHQSAPLPSVRTGFAEATMDSTGTAPKYRLSQLRLRSLPRTQTSPSATSRRPS